MLILKLRKEGKTYKDIQKTLKCSAKMVSNAIKYKWKPENRGTKHKTTDIEDRRIVSYSKVYRFASFRDIKSELNLGISDVTIRRRLLNQNFSARSPRKVPLPSPRHIKARLSLAKTYLNWPVSKWRNILWTDGSKIMLFGGTGSLQYI
uniref:Drosophila melanogaster transposon HB1 n=1 Tax=Drosophila melanogaster TaxID=7227 RepID=Q27293_DROME|nr:unnamed protein product [Drosophila melanogaster]CAA25884.1 unnamed protein product [Drosophila melanogaster]